MGTLIYYEMKKIVAQKKNSWAMLAFVICILVFIVANIRLENNAEEMQMNELYFEISDANQMINAASTAENASALNVDYYTEKSRVLNELLTAYQNGDRHGELVLENELDTLILSNETLSENEIASLNEELDINQILLEKGIEPENTQYSMQSYQFIRLVNGGMMPFLMLLLILLVSSDVVSEEIETGTYKALFTQPVKRTNLLIAKSIAQTGFFLLFFLLIFSVFFFGLGVFRGFGVVDYPVLIYSGEYIGIGQLILTMLPLMVLNLMAAVSFSVLCSVLFDSGTASISAAMIVMTLLYLISSKMMLFRSIAGYNPLMYWNVPAVLYGTYSDIGVFYQTGLVVMPIVIVICYVSAFLVFKKKTVNVY
ncbi:MAG: ABC transporter permease subunit [Anaerofustis sp.]